MIPSEWILSKWISSYSDSYSYSLSGDESAQRATSDAIGTSDPVLDGTSLLQGDVFVKYGFFCNAESATHWYETVRKIECQQNFFELGLIFLFLSNFGNFHLKKWILGKN